MVAAHAIDIRSLLVRVLNGKQCSLTVNGFRVTRTPISHKLV